MCSCVYLLLIFIDSVGLEISFCHAPRHYSDMTYPRRCMLGCFQETDSEMESSMKAVCWECSAFRSPPALGERAGCGEESRTGQSEGEASGGALQRGWPLGCPEVRQGPGSRHRPVSGCGLAWKGAGGGGLAWAESSLRTGVQVRSGHAWQQFQGLRSDC